MSDPVADVIDILYGRWRCQALYAGTNLGVFDAVSSTPRSAIDLADELAVDPDLLYRLLRGLSSIGVLKEHVGRHFAITETGKVLRAEHPQTLRYLVLNREGPEHYRIWQHLSDMVRDGVQDGFRREYGKPAFEYAEENSEYADQFDKAMTGHSSTQTGWTLDALRDMDFATLSTVCDVAGGQGHLLCHFLARYPHLKGKVLDRPSVFEDRDALWAERLHVADRCEYVPGDMFVGVPPADIYFLKLILHDWDDADCVRILRNMWLQAPTGGRVFIVEHVVPGIDTPHYSKLFDLHMMCWGPGRERTEEEFAGLLEGAGWTYVKTRFPAEGHIGVVEGHKA